MLDWSNIKGIITVKIQKRTEIELAFYWLRWSHKLCYPQQHSFRNNINFFGSFVRWVLFYGLHEHMHLIYKLSPPKTITENLIGRCHDIKFADWQKFLSIELTKFQRWKIRFKNISKITSKVLSRWYLLWYVWQQTTHSRQ